jgi:hypothetical protein
MLRGQHNQPILYLYLYLMLYVLVIGACVMICIGCVLCTFVSHIRQQSRHKAFMQYVELSPVDNDDYCIEELI